MDVTLNQRKQEQNLIIFILSEKIKQYFQTGTTKFLIAIIVDFFYHNRNELSTLEVHLKVLTTKYFR